MLKSKQDDQTIIENFYKNMTDQHLSQVQSDKIKHLLSFILDRGVRFEAFTYSYGELWPFY